MSTRNRYYGGSAEYWRGVAEERDRIVELLEKQLLTYSEGTRLRLAIRKAINSVQDGPRVR